MFKKIFLNETYVLLLILFNAVIVFASAFTFSNALLQLTLLRLDAFITLLFLVELIVKVRAWGFKTYISSNWNKLDFFLIILTLPSVAILFDAEPSFGILMVFRVLRVFKFFRFIKFIPGVDELITSIARALKTSLLVILGFVVYLFIISLFSCYLYKEVSPELFGDPLKSIHSIFRIFTVEGWYEIPKQILEQPEHGNKYLINIYFILILITGGILGLSLVNSIFVDAMVSDNNDELIAKVDELSEKIERLIKEKEPL